MATSGELPIRQRIGTADRKLQLLPGRCPAPQPRTSLPQRPLRRPGPTTASRPRAKPIPPRSNSCTAGNLGLGGRGEPSDSTAYWWCCRGAELNTIRLQGNPKRNGTRKLGATLLFAINSGGVFHAPQFSKRGRGLSPRTIVSARTVPLDDGSRISFFLGRSFPCRRRRHRPALGRDASRYRR